MSKRVADSLAVEFRKELMVGRYVRWNEVSQLVYQLDRVHKKTEGLVKAGQAKRALRLYKIFLSGVYEKIEEADDECYLAMLFHRLICGWIQALQAAGYPAKKTVTQLCNWIEKDNRGFCHQIEKEVVKVLDAPGQRLFIDYFQNQLQRAMSEPGHGPAQATLNDDHDLLKPALTLKDIYESLNDASSYAVLCEKVGFSKRDGERLAKMEMAHRHWAKALDWVDKGKALKSDRTGHDDDSHDLDRLKLEILHHLGRKQEALASAWSAFQEKPNQFTFEHLMRCVAKGKKAAWKERAMAATDKARLDHYVSLCVKAKDWDRLARRVHATHPSELENLSRYRIAPAARGLATRDALAAARLYRALGLRSMNSANSRQYAEALGHFRKACDLYGIAGQAAEWNVLVTTVRMAHSQEAAFLSAFEKIGRQR
jgi:hypothetical protein